MGEDFSNAIRQALSYFEWYYRYTKERLAADYQTETDQYRDDTWEAPQRAARLSAAVKNYKTSQMLAFIFDLAMKNNLDLTPLGVRRLCQGLFGRVGSQSIIVDVFGQRHREHRSTDSSRQATDALIQRYRLSACGYWSDTLADIENVKREYRKIIKSRNAKK